MSAALPTLFTWDGEAMRPAYPKLAAGRYKVGEEYLLAPTRSDASHKHAFAWIGEAWKSLPEHLAQQYPTADHLRKRALIDAGWYDEQVIDCGSKAAALRVAAGVRARPGEAFSLVITRGPAVVIRTARSMAKAAMVGPEWQACKSAVLDTVAELIGVTPETLNRQREGA